MGAGGGGGSRYAQIVIKEPNTSEPKKAKRKRITPDQLKELTAVFEKTDTPTHDIREALSKRLNMTNREVQVWFQNRRAKYNRLRIEQQRQQRASAAIIYGTALLPLSPAAVPPPPPPPPPQPLPLQFPAYAHPAGPPPYPSASAPAYMCAYQPEPPRHYAGSPPFHYAGSPPFHYAGTAVPEAAPSPPLHYERSYGPPPVTLPPISAMLAGARSPHRLRAYTSPSPGQHHGPPASAAAAATHRDCSAGMPPHAQLGVPGAKLGIDVLAAAAVSVSSARSGGSLPHLTPLSEFSLAAPSPYICHRPPAARRPSGPHSRRVTPVDGGRAARSWRPW
ncbi:hypothetical protein H4R18_004158 [Coemansia javaensis]|uniref:Homeobox domain-containing protein n=1 Tax=Coemansia javaensis TaxID=2761396 RepID=A0A9W8H5P2_9FUNG|nr:hypothetical protein H4R18_004158 [Coemansia javaensis]